MMGRKSEEKRLIESDKRKKRTSVGIIGDSLVVVAVVRGWMLVGERERERRAVSEGGQGKRSTMEYDSSYN